MIIEKTIKSTATHQITLEEAQNLHKIAEAILCDVTKMSNVAFREKYYAVTIDASVFTTCLPAFGESSLIHILSGFPIAEAGNSFIDNFRYVLMMLNGVGVDIDCRVVSGMTPLHFAACNKAAQQINLLLMAGAKVDALNEGGLTPLFFALSRDVPVSKAWDKLSASDKDKACKLAAANLLFRDAKITPLMRKNFFDDPVFKELLTMFTDQTANENSARIERLEQQIKAQGEQIASLERETKRQKFEIDHLRSKATKSESAPDMRKNKLFGM